MTNAVALTPELCDFLRQVPGGRLLLFAHPGYEACVQLLRQIGAQVPGLRITLLTYVTLTPQQQAELGAEAVLTFDKGAVASRTALLRLARATLASVRGGGFGATLIWYRGWDTCQYRLVLELFTLLDGVGLAAAWDDRSGRLRRIRPAPVLFGRIPFTLGKLLLVGLALLLAQLLLPVAALGRPARRRHRGGPLRIGFLRTDLEVAMQELSVGGSVSHVQGVVGGMLDEGHRVITYAAAPLAGLDPQRVPARCIPVWLSSDLPMECLELLANVPFIWHGLRQMRRDGIDLIYQRYSLHNAAGVLLARLLGIPVVLEANNSEVEMRRQWSRLFLPGLARRLERLVLTRADLVVTVSERNRQTFHELGYTPVNLQVMPNAVDPKRFAPEQGDGGLRAQLGLEGRVVIGFVGLFYPWHGVAHLARAFAALASQAPAAHLLLVGDGDERSRVQAILEAAGLLDRVTFTGLVPHARVPHYLQAMDIVVAPHAPWKEFFGSPIKLFEYMASGRAVVVSNLGQLGEIIRDGETGLLVPPGDETALAAALRELVDAPALRTALGAAARADVIAHHTWRQTVAAILRSSGPATPTGNYSQPSP